MDADTFPEDSEVKLKITRLVRIDKNVFHDIIERYSCSTMDVRRAVEHWSSKMQIPDITSDIEFIIADYDDEVGIDRSSKIIPEGFDK